MRTTTIALIAAAALAAAGATPVLAQDERWEVGLRGIVVTAGGEPANDIMGPGLWGSMRLGDGPWSAELSVDLFEHDFERPWQVLGLQQDEALDTIDTTVESMVVTGWLRRDLGRWFWAAGLGLASPDADDVSGPLQGGGTFDIATDAGSEIVVSAAAGLRLRLGGRFTLRGALRADHHLADWEVTDRVSGRTATVDDYTGYGIDLGLGMRF